MGRKRHSAEKTLNKRRQADVELGKGNTVAGVCTLPGVSERRACRVLGQARAVRRHTPAARDDEDRLTGRMIELAAAYGRYGTPRIGALLQREGWRVNHKRVERIWRREGPKVPRRHSPIAGDCGSSMGAASACGPNTRTMTGRATSCAA
jgi:hypothetical protein